MSTPDHSSKGKEVEYEYTPSSPNDPQWALPQSSSPLTSPDTKRRRMEDIVGSSSRQRDTAEEIASLKARDAAIECGLDRLRWDLTGTDQLHHQLSHEVDALRYELGQVHGRFDVTQRRLARAESRLLATEQGLAAALGRIAELEARLPPAEEPEAEPEEDPEEDPEEEPEEDPAEDPEDGDGEVED